MYIVSGCLLGHNCKYNGGNNRNDGVMEFCKSHRYIAVCPERAANLPCPRPPAEKVKQNIEQDGRRRYGSFRKRGENIHEHVQ